MIQTVNSVRRLFLLWIPNWKYLNILQMMYYIFLQTVIALLSTLYLIRSYILYFDMQHSQAMKNKEWRMAINPNHFSWYLDPKNQKLFAKNGKNLIIIGFILTIIESGLLAMWLVAFNSVVATMIQLVSISFVKVCTYPYVHI